MRCQEDLGAIFIGRLFYLLLDTVGTNLILKITYWAIFAFIPLPKFLLLFCCSCIFYIGIGFQNWIQSQKVLSEERKTSIAEQLNTSHMKQGCRKAVTWILLGLYFILNVWIWFIFYIEHHSYSIHVCIYYICMKVYWKAFDLSHFLKSYKNVTFLSMYIYFFLWQSLCTSKDLLKKWKNSPT